MEVKNLEVKYASVQTLYSVGDDLRFSMIKFREAGMLTKAAAAEKVVNDLYGLVEIQSALINELTHDFLNQRLELDALKQRVGL